MATVDRSTRVSTRPIADFFYPLWRLLTSVRFAVTFIGALALVGLAGVLIPQIPEAMRGNDAAVSVWLDGQRDTFGALTDPMHRAGLFNVFQAHWFLVALGFLVVNVSVCVFNRWSPTFRNVFRPPRRVPETFFERAHNRATLGAVTPDAAVDALRRMRFRAEVTHDEGGATYVFADRFPWAQLGTFVSHLAIILFLAGGLVSWMTGFSASMFTGEGTTMPVFAVSDRSQIQVRVDDAIGVFGDRGNALDFRTHLTIFRNGEEVASGFTTVNDPLHYGGYRFHQVAYFPDGAALRIRDNETGNTVFRETFPMEETTAAPLVTITDDAGRVLLQDVIAPTDFLPNASGAFTSLRDAGRTMWIGITPGDGETWQLVAYDPEIDQGARDLRIGEGETGEIAGLRLRFDGVEAIPSAIGIGVPGSDGPLLAQITDDAGGDPVLLLVGQGRPAVALAENDPVVVDGYEYTFEGPREFAGISVRRDRGAWFIWTATAMLLVGLAITFYVPRRRLWLRITPRETRIAALAEKSGGFETDMRTLATRLGVPLPPELQEET